MSDYWLIEDSPPWSWLVGWLVGWFAGGSTKQ